MLSVFTSNVPSSLEHLEVLGEFNTLSECSCRTPGELVLEVIFMVQSQSSTALSNRFGIDIFRESFKTLWMILMSSA